MSKAIVKGQILVANYDHTWEINDFSIEIEVPLYVQLDSVIEQHARSLHMRLHGYKTQYVYLHKVTSFTEKE